MNNIFSPKRFGHYFIYDLRNAWRNFGIPALVLALSPFIIFTIGLIFRLITRGEWTPDFSLFGITYIFIIMIAIMSAPTTIYGKLTQKRYGTDFLMLPASVFEKWLSMLTVLCVVYPLLFAAILCGSDSLLNTAFPDFYNSNLIHTLNRLSNGYNGYVTVNVYAGEYINWCTGILTMALGAMCFKKAKIAKTILAMFGISCVFGMGFGILICHFPEWMNDLVRNEEEFIRLLNIVINVCSFLSLTILGTATYFRLKTIKH